MPGFFLYFYWIFVFLFSIEKLATMVLHIRVWESLAGDLISFQNFCLSFPVYRR
jgi:hypothetical protein